MIYQLIYLSHASKDLNYSDLENILQVSRKNNEALKLTGILIYKDDQFIQLLEGDRENVLSIMDRIEHDQRNQNVKILYQGESAERFFADWSMAYADGDLASNDNPACRRLFQMAQQFRPEMREFIFSAMKEFKEGSPSLR
ncbi:MAG: BLUF domain-containing protein [Bdellovibrionia bacterium]